MRNCMLYRSLTCHIFSSAMSTSWKCRPCEKAARGIAQRSIGRRRQNASVLDVASAVAAGQRCKGKVLLQRVPRVRGHCGRGTLLPDRCRSAAPTVYSRIYPSCRPVTRNGRVTRIAESGMRADVVPALPISAVWAGNGAIAVFTGAAPIVGCGIVRGPGKAVCQAQMRADLPPFQHLPGRLHPRNRVSRRKPEAMPHVHVAIPVLILRVRRVRHGRRRLRALCPIVECVAVGIRGQEVQAVVIPAIKGHLQCVVVRTESIRGFEQCN